MRTLRGQLKGFPRRLNAFMKVDELLALLLLVQACAVTTGLQTVIGEDVLLVTVVWLVVAPIQAVD